MFIICYCCCCCTRAESIKSNIEKSFEEPEKKIFTEDLKTLIYLVNTDADVEFIVKAIKK